MVSARRQRGPNSIGSFKGSKGKTRFYTLSLLFVIVAENLRRMIKESGIFTSWVIDDIHSL